jgi:hypothetical protein
LIQGWDLQLELPWKINGVGEPYSCSGSGDVSQSALKLPVERDAPFQNRRQTLALTTVSHGSHLSTRFLLRWIIANLGGACINETMRGTKTTVRHRGKLGLS